MIGSHFLAALGWSSMLLLPLYLDHLGASRTEIGSIMASGAIGSLCLRPLVGWTLDRVGRKPTVVAGVIFQVIGMVLVYFVVDLGPMAYAQRIVFGFGQGAIFTGYFTYATDFIPASRRTEGIALFGIAGLLPLAINPLLGETAFGVAGLRLFFPSVAVVMAFSLVALWPLPETLPRRGGGAGTERPPHVFRSLTRAPLWPVWLAAVVFAGMVATFMAFVSVTAEHRGLARPASVWLTYAGGAIAVRVFGGRLPDRVGPSNLVTPALSTYALAALIAAGAQGQPGFMLAGLIAGLGHGYCFPVLTSQVVTRMPDAHRGSALAMFTALWEAASLGATPLFGAAADRTDDATMFALLALCGVSSLVIWTALEHRFAPSAGLAHPGNGE